MNFFGKKTEKSSSAQKTLSIDAALANSVAPLGLGFEKNYFNLGECTASALGVIKYPPRLEVGWLSKLTNLQSTITHIKFEPVAVDILIDALNKNIKYDLGKAASTNSAIEAQRAEARAQDGIETMQKIDREGENVGKMNIVIVPIGKDENSLSKLKRKCSAEASIAKLKTKTLSFLQKEAYKYISPSGEKDTDKIERVLDRIVPLSTFIGGFPHASSGFNDGEGYYLGKDSKGSLIVLNPWKRGGDRTNTNFVITGISGVGKSAAIKHIALSEFMNDTKIIIIDPESEYKEMCKNLNGSWIDTVGGTGGMINPFEIRRQPETDEEEENKSYVGGLSAHMKTLEVFFSLYMQSLGDEEIAIVKLVLRRMYKRFDIDFETDTSSLTSENYPTFSDFYKELALFEKNEKDEERKKTYSKLKLLFRDVFDGGDSRIWNGKSTVNANSDFVVFDTSALQSASDSVKRAQYYNVLNYAWDILVGEKDRKVLIICDEAYLMIDEKVPESLIYLRNVMKRARKYEGGIAVISHSIVDFLAEPIKQYGQALLDLPTFKILMGTDGENLRETTKLYSLTEAEQDLLLSKTRGKALFMAGSKRLQVNFEIPEYKFEYFGAGGGR